MDWRGEEEEEREQGEEVFVLSVHQPRAPVFPGSVSDMSVFSWVLCVL